MQISILLPVYNGQNYLQETIESVLRNTKEVSCELIVVNDGSIDLTDQICQNFGRTIIYLKQYNQGESVAINFGLRKASGKYILVVSHDDPMLSSQLIPKAIQILENNPEISCVYPDWQIIDSIGNIVEVKEIKEYSELELIGRFNCLPGPGAIFRRGQAIEIGGRKKWKYVSDYDFWLRLSRKGEFKRIPEVLAQWRSHPNSTTISSKSLDMALERIEVMKEFLNENLVDENIRRQALSSAYYFAARLGIFSPKIPAKKWLWTSFRIRQSWPEVASALIVLFIFTMPISCKALRALSVFSKKLKNLT